MDPMLSSIFRFHTVVTSDLLPPRRTSRSGWITLDLDMSIYFRGMDSIGCVLFICHVYHRVNAAETKNN